MYIATVEGLRGYLNAYSGFTQETINNVVSALGFPLYGSQEELKDLSTELENCAAHGADIGISGFIYYSETIAFYSENRADIVSHMENTAAELGTDIISMVQGFGVFRNSEKPSVDEIGKALWGSIQDNPEYTTLYTVFAWYALEEVARVWFDFLEENPYCRADLSA
jgi:hypothetical protein